MTLLSVSLLNFTCKACDPCQRACHRLSAKHISFSETLQLQMSSCQLSTQSQPTALPALYYPFIAQERYWLHSATCYAKATVHMDVCCSLLSAYHLALTPQRSLLIADCSLPQVTTMRSKGCLKPLIPCLDDPVTKLEGLGEKTRRNLLDVRACAASLDFAGSVPPECRNSVATGLLIRSYYMFVSARVFVCQVHSIH